MARASTYTLLPLDRFAAIIGINPLHFNSVTATSVAPNRYACDDVWFQYNWQDIGKMSREDLAYAIYEAERRVMDELGYPPIAYWIEDEEILLPAPYSPELRYTTRLNLRSQPKSVESRYGYVIDFGRQEKTAIDIGAAVAYSDSTGDSYNDLATVTVVTTVTDIEEIRVYFPDESGADIWEIRGVNVAISGGTATITFPKYMAVNPSLWESLSGDADGKFGVDGDNDSNFLSTVDVYQVSIDPSTQATFIYNTPCTACGATGCTECEASTESGCLQVRDAKQGRLTYARATWNATSETFSTASFSQGVQPDRISISYRAGLQSAHTSYPLTRMRPDWERLIAYYSLTLMDNQIANCDNIRRVVQRQIEDMAESTDTKSRAVSEGLLENPFGTSRAAINLWQKIRRERLARAH